MPSRKQTARERAAERAAIRKAGGGHALAKLMLQGRGSPPLCKHGEKVATCTICARNLP